MDVPSLLLVTAFRQTINEPNIEAAHERFQALHGGMADFGAFSDAVNACLEAGLIKEPIRLPDGALQCHWHLELTATGVAEARRRIIDSENRPREH